MSRVGMCLLALLLLLACSTVPSPEPITTPGIGGTWTAVRVGQLTPIPMKEPRVQFTVGGQITGESGCSDFEGPFEIVGNSIGVGQLVSTYTDPACDRAVRAVHEAFVATLRTAQSIEELGRGRLRLSGASGDMILLREGRMNHDLTPEEADSIALLQAQPWVVVEATGVPANAAGSVITFGLAESEHADHELAVDAPCAFTASYRSRGDDRIQVHTPSYDDDAEHCAAAGDILRAWLLEAMLRVTHFEFDAAGSRVTLRGLDVTISLEVARPAP